MTKIFSANYFLYYTQLSTFIIIVAVPLASLVLLNWLIWGRLKEFRRVALRLCPNLVGSSLGLALGPHFSKQYPIGFY